MQLGVLLSLAGVETGWAGCFLNATLLGPPLSVPASLTRTTADSLSHSGRSVKRFCFLSTCSHLIQPKNKSETRVKMKHLKITAVLLLLVQVFHLALLQDSTDSPGRTIDKSWLRQKPKNTAQNENTQFPDEESENYQGTDAPQFTNNFIASGSMAINSEEVESGNETHEYSDIVTTPNLVSERSATKQPELLNSTIPSMTTIFSNLSQTNMTEAKEELNSTVITADNSTSFPFFSNDTELHLTTLAPENNTTEESTTPPYADKGLTNHTGSTNTTGITTAAPKTSKTSTTSTSRTVLPSGTSDMSTMTMTSSLPNTPERVNKTGKGASSSKKDLDSHLYQSKRNVAWVAVLGTAAAMACVGLVAYIILKKKHQKGFTHRKLVEEYPSDPVLRLDNSEPLDLNFGGSAYYNPGLQGDSIQMTNFSGQR
ncbi:mucin-15 [Melanotaenia boesemani]|uniref:mucin-15 n=1 Tax=Melanotaenia boesemani TaxID=1250792 RepID=UPI001C051B63|nr:mucin-15 [Melanotaenia boesemani]